MPWGADDIRVWRERMRYTQTDAARELGVDRRTVYRWEHETTPIPKMVMLACMYLLEQRGRLRAVVQRTERRGGLRPPGSYRKRRRLAPD